MGVLEVTAARGRWSKWIMAGLIAAAACTGAWAQTRVTGTISGNDPDGDVLRISFSCTGTPTCNGTYTLNYKDPGCSNTLSYIDTIVLTGMDLSKPGNLNGTLTGQTDFDYNYNSNGTCTFVTVISPFTVPFTGTWNGTSGTLLIGGFIPGNFTASVPSSAPPVFPMTVTGSVTPTTSNISAQFTPRAQDVGTTASVFIFAHVPASLLRKDLAKLVPPGMPIPYEPQDDDYCVLAQINAGGQLSGVTASNMQALTTGVLTAQGQAVTVLNNVPTPSISGATFYVGYGSTASAMLANGIYQNAVSVPGAGSQCTASLSSSPTAAPTGPLTGLWYNASESGWGVHFTQRRNVVFGAWYTYDANGAPKWYVASSCNLPTGVTGSTGTCSGSLYEVSGPTFFGATFNPALVNVKTAGTLTVNFANANSASMNYTANGQTRTVNIARQVFASGTSSPAIDYTDLWYNASESGWGMAISHQFGVMFLAWYVYDGTGKPVWYVASNCAVGGSGCSGTLYRTTGPPLGPTFNSSQVQVFTAGTVSLTFTDANNGLLTYTVGTTTSTKAITRQLF